MANRFGSKALRWAALGCAVAVSWSAILQVTALVAPWDSNPIACSLIQFGASLLVGLAAYAAARAPARSRRIVDPVIVLGTVTVATLLWRHLLYGTLSAASAISSGAHARHTGFGHTDVCINGHLLHGVPAPCGCFGCVGSRPDSYYRGYFATLRFVYHLLPRARDCGPLEPS